MGVTHGHMSHAVTESLIRLSGSQRKNATYPGTVKGRQRLLTGTLCHTSQQPPSLGGYNPSYKARSLKTRGLRHVI